MKATIKKFGISFDDGTDIVCVTADEKYGQQILVRGRREELEIRITPSGMLRFGAVRKSGRITADGVS